MSVNNFDFSGTYEGEIDGMSTSIELTQSGQNLTGDINKGGLIYNIVGIATDDTIQGRMSDAGNIEAYMLQAEINNSFLIIHLISHDLETRTISKDSYTFKKTAADKKQTESQDEEQINNLEFDIDPALIGRWAREEILRNAEDALSTQVVIELDEQGNYKLVGSIELKGVKDTGYSGDTTSGKWRAHKNTFYILVSGSKFWKPYAKYKLEDNDHMTFVVEDGERLNWVKSSS